MLTSLTYLQQQKDDQIHSRKHYINAHAHQSTRVHIRAHVTACAERAVFTHAQTHTRTRTRTHMHTHAYLHARAHAFTHTKRIPLSLSRDNQIFKVVVVDEHFQVLVVFLWFRWCKSYVKLVGTLAGDRGRSSRGRECCKVNSLMINELHDAKEREKMPWLHFCGSYAVR